MKKSIKENVFFANLKNYFGLLTGFMVLCIVFTILEPTFLSTANIMNVLRQISVNAVLAYGMTFVLLAAGIDLSMGSLVSFASVFCAYFISMKGMSVVVVVILALAIGGILGCVNRLIVTKTGMWPFIVTLSTSLIIGGLAYSISKGSPVRVMNDTFNVIGTGFIGPVSLPIAYMLVLLIVCYIILQRTCLGRHIYAVGGNAEAAKFAGINIVKTGVIVYTISGVLATFTGIFLTARMYTGQPTLGASMVNDAIAATVVGGTSISGGKGRIVGTLIGAMLIGIIGNGMNLLGLSSYLQDIAKGLIILGAVYIDTISTKRIQKTG